MLCVRGLCVSVAAQRLVRAAVAVTLAVTGVTAAGSGSVRADEDEVPAGSPIGPHVTVLHSCATTRGRVDVSMVNVLDQPATYRVDVSQPETPARPRSKTRQIESLGSKHVIFTVPENSLGSYEVTVWRDDVEVHSQPIDLLCSDESRAPATPEASVVNACRNGAGFIRAFYVNPGPDRQDWSVTLTSLDDPAAKVLRRTRVAPGFGQRAANFGRRTDGTYRVDFTRGDKAIRSFFVDVDCVDPAWDTTPEQLRVLEIAYVPPSAGEARLVDQSTSIYYRGEETVTELSNKITGDTDYLAGMLEQGSRSNNGFGVQGVDIDFVDRVEIRERPPVDTKFLLKREAAELDIGDPRLQPGHPNSFDRQRVRCAGERIPDGYQYGQLENADDFDRWVVIDLGDGLTESLYLEGLVPEGRCVYLAEVSRPNYPEILENQLMALPADEFSGAGGSFCEYVEREQIDQVWIWTDHGYQVEPAEAVMSSRTGVTFNAANEDIELNGHRLFPQCAKTYTGFNFNYTRAPSVHVFIHAIEGLMSWGPNKYSEADKAIFGWEGQQNNRLDGTFGTECGDAHWAPNVPRRPGEGHWTEYVISITSEVPTQCFGWNPVNASTVTVTIPNPLVHAADTNTATVTSVSCATWNGCPPDGSANPWTETDPGQGNTDIGVQNYEVWWMQQLPGLGFEHLAVYNGRAYRVNSPWSILADPDRFIVDGKSIESARDESLMLAGFP